MPWDVDRLSGREFELMLASCPAPVDAAAQGDVRAAFEELKSRAAGSASRVGVE